MNSSSVNSARVVRDRVRFHLKAPISRFRAVANDLVVILAEKKTLFVRFVSIEM